MKFRRNRANINIVIGISNDLSHTHWPIFEDEKGERVEIGDVNFHKKPCCLNQFDCLPTVVPSIKIDIVLKK